MRRLVMAIFLLGYSHGAYVLPPNYGRFEVKDAMSSENVDRLGVHCQRPSLDLEEVLMYPGDVYIHDFYADERVVKGWTCHFYWYNRDSEDVQRTQDFQVWNMNGTSAYLDGCDYCRWKIREDGFYLQSRNSKETSKNTWTFMFEWNQPDSFTYEHGLEQTERVL
ncbi:hypothetical protein R1flu_008927 [Riccia fluitans]|uniref:S-protein homolog n=1 Tax=Riccia fluitans TaxID=41844 RepID=A0ABD1Z0L8_9MARC